MPLMTENGTFIINGTERVIVSQMHRSPGVYFETEEERSTGRKLASSKLIPDRGAWMEFETRKSDALVLKFNRKRRSHPHPNSIYASVSAEAGSSAGDSCPAGSSPPDSSPSYNSPCGLLGFGGSVPSRVIM